MNAAGPHVICGTAVAIDGRGLLLTGLPGVGKSELALTLIDRGARLVSDDMVQMHSDRARILIDAPVANIGRLALRDIGIVTVAHSGHPVPLSLVIHLDPAAKPVAGPPRIDRITPLPDRSLAIPRLTINPETLAVTAKLMLALDRWGL